MVYRRFRAPSAFFDAESKCLPSLLSCRCCCAVPQPLPCRRCTSIVPLSLPPSRRCRCRRLPLASSCHGCQRRRGHLVPATARPSSAVYHRSAVPVGHTQPSSCSAATSLSAPSSIHRECHTRLNRTTQEGLAALLLLLHALARTWHIHAHDARTQHTGTTSTTSTSHLYGRASASHTYMVVLVPVTLIW